MGVRTGRPRGRPPGAKSKRTRKREEDIQAAAAAIEGLLPDVFKGDSHAFLMSIYKNVQMPLDKRLSAAQTAIAYEKPRLASTNVTMDDKRTAAERSAAELERELEQAHRDLAGVIASEAGHREPDQIH